MALEVMRKSVALSVTWRILSLASPVRRRLSSSDKDLKYKDYLAWNTEHMADVKAPNHHMHDLHWTHHTWSYNICEADLCRAEPCLEIRSLHVLRSSTLLPSVLRADWTSELWEPPPWPGATGRDDGEKSSPESSGTCPAERRRKNISLETVSQS